MSKIIGITPSQDEKNTFTLGRMYVKAIESVGGLPLILPIIDESRFELITQMIEKVDGILLSGGVDVDPLQFGEEPAPNLGTIDPERDLFELAVARLALEKGKPILGICRGCQILNIAAGGTIIQDIASAFGGDKIVKHRQSSPRWHLSHTIDIVEGSKLFEIFGNTELTINSFHHQAVNRLAEGFVVTANAKDGIIEAIESVKHKYAIGVQWHPELLWERHPHFAKLFESFLKAC